MSLPLSDLLTAHELADALQGQLMRQQIPDAWLGTISQTAQEAGETLLQAYHLGATPSSHFERLFAGVDWTTPATVVDIGCGLGACSHWLAQTHPEAVCVNLNRSWSQLTHCSRALSADGQCLPLKDACADVVVLCYVMGFGLPLLFLKEAARVLKPTGTVVLYDLWCAEPERFLTQTGYASYRPQRLNALAEAVGLTLTFHLLPDLIPSHYLRNANGQEAFDALFAHCHHVLAYGTKEV